MDNSTLSQTDEEPFTWSTAVDIFEIDNRMALEIVYARKGGELLNIMHPAGDKLFKRNIFHAAVECSATNCLRFLIEKDVLSYYINMPDSEGRTPLHYAIEFGFRKDSYLIFECFKLLILNNGDVNAIDNNGDTPMHNLLQINLCANENTEKYRLLPYLKVMLSCTRANLRAKNFNNQAPIDIKPFFSHDCNQDDVILRRLFSAVDERRNYKHITIADITSGNFTDLQDVTLPVFYGSKTLLYHLVSKCSYAMLEKALIRGLNPLIQNVDDQYLPIHSALLQHDTKKLKLIMKHMTLRSGSWAIDFKHVECSLIKTLLCNVPHNEELKNKHFECFEIIQQQYEQFSQEALDLITTICNKCFKSQIDSEITEFIQILKKKCANYRTKSERNSTITGKV